MLSYQEFMQLVEDRILSFCPPDYQDREVQVFLRKETYGKGEGLVLYKEGSHAVPVVYLREYYREMQENHIPAERILQKIADDYQEAELQAEHMQVPDLNDPELLFNALVTKVVNFDRNQEMLEAVPYLQINDLAVVAMISISGEEAIVVTDDLCEHLKLDGDMVVAAAIRNNAKVGKPFLGSLGDVVMQMADDNSETGRELRRVAENTPSPFYVLTNEANFYGASMIASKDVLDAAAEVAGEQYYILPSSVHEVLIVPEKGIAPEVLKKMVMEGNRIALKDEDFLSDNVYQYNSRARELKMYTGRMEHEKVRAKTTKPPRPRR